jgi:2-polyprenyl-6-methoxyphenol hydroxylase-like FAD-dependent oxidoreductase
MNSNQKIGIVGAGIAGLTAGIMLEKLGYQVEIFEAAEKVRGIGAGIGLASNAMKAFEYLDLDHEVMDISNHLKQFQIVDSKGKTILKTATDRISQSYNTENFVVHRADLHAYLLNKLKSTQVFTGLKLVKFEQYENSVRLKFEKGEEKVFDYLIGADGVNSVIRQTLIPNSGPRYAGYWCWRSVVKLKRQLNEGTEVWGKNGRFGISPLNDNRIYWYACVNSNLKDGIPEFELKDLKNRYRDYFPFIQELLELSNDEELISTPIVDIRPTSKFHFGRILLIGDAAHATTPNMGQGACMGIEDVAVLQEELTQNDWDLACENFEKRRMKRTKYIIEKSELAGRIAQSDNPIVNSIRNNLIRILPDSIAHSQMKRLLEEDFMKI